MKNKLNIVHMTTVHHYEDPRIFWKQCRSLAAAGHEVTLLAQSTEKEPFEKAGVRIVPLKKRSRRFVSMLLSPIEAWIKAKKLQADVYHFHDPELLLTARLLKKPVNKVVYDVHEDYETGITSRAYFNSFIRKGLSRIYKKVENAVIAPMDVVIAEKYYAEKYSNAHPVLNYPVLEQNESQRLERTFEGKKSLLYTGNITEDRGAFHHAALAAALPAYTIDLVGKCPKRLADAMKSLQGNNQNLHITGVDTFVPKHVIDSFYAKDEWLAGLAVFPKTDHYQKKELTKFFEYMLAGIPIICSNFPAWSDFVHTYKCGLTVDPEDLQDVQQAVLYLANNPEEAKRLGENGRRAVIQELNWEWEAEKLLALYEEM